jgi:hypothetical protein
MALRQPGPVPGRDVMAGQDRRAVGNIVILSQVR